MLFDTLNVSLIGEQLLSSKVERQYHVKGIREDMGMESDVSCYKTVVYLLYWRDAFPNSLDYCIEGMHLSIH